jgi:hypothetical protein
MTFGGASEVALAFNGDGRGRGGLYRRKTRFLNRSNSK